MSGLLATPAAVPPMRGAAGGAAGAAGAAGAGAGAGTSAGTSAAPATQAGPLDIVFVIDSSGLMKLVWPVLPTVLKGVMESTLANRTALHADVRWAVIAFTGFPKRYQPRQDEVSARVLVDFADVDTVYEAVRGLTCEPGYVCKDVVSGLAKTRELSWREGSVRSTVLMLGGPPHGVVKLNPAIEADEEFFPQYDYFPQGSPTGWRLEHLLDHMQSDQLNVCRQYVVWCEEEPTDSTLRAGFAKSCHSLVIPQPSQREAGPEAVPVGAAPPGFFTWYLSAPQDVISKLSAVVCELMVSSFMMQAIDGYCARHASTEDKDIDALAPIVHAAVSSVVASTPALERTLLPGPNGCLVSLGSAPIVADLVRRVINQRTHSSTVSTMSMQAGVIPATALTIAYDSEEAKTARPVLLGRGQFGSVFKGTYTKRRNGKVVSIEEVAIKAVQIEVDEATEMPCEDDLIELRALLTVGRGGRRGVVRFTGWTHPSAAIRDILDHELGLPGPTQRWLLLVMRLYDFTLAEALADRRLTDQQMMTAAYEIACGLFYIHKDNRVMQDLKPENVLLGRDERRADERQAPPLRAVIADLGMATRIFHGMMIGGNLAFTDPDVLSRRVLSSPATDMYSFGKLLEVMGHAMTATPAVFSSLLARCTGPPSERPTATDAMGELKRFASAM